MNKQPIVVSFHITKSLSVTYVFDQVTDKNGTAKFVRRGTATENEN